MSPSVSMGLYTARSVFPAKHFFVLFYLMQQQQQFRMLGVALFRGFLFLIQQYLQNIVFTRAVVFLSNTVAAVPSNSVVFVVDVLYRSLQQYLQNVVPVGCCVPYFYSFVIF